MDKNFKPAFWRLSFLLLSLAYLIPEAIFNAQLVSLVGLGMPDPSSLERLEVFGRAISGIGVTLLLADLLPSAFYKTVWRGVGTVLVLAVITWPTVYFGQKILIERFLIAPSTPEQREYAVLSAVFRDALAINAVEVEDLEYDPEAKNSSENLTFLALFAGLLYADRSLADNLEAYKENIIRQSVQNRAYQDFEAHYTDFSTLYTRLSASYSEYAQGSNDYNQALADIPDREQVYWQVIEQEVNEGWHAYQKATRVHIARAEARAQEYGPKIYRFNEQLNRCAERYDGRAQQSRRQRCTERLHARYKSDISKAGLGYIEPNYWLIVEDVSITENVSKTLFAGLLTGGVSTAAQVLDLATGGDGGIRDKRYTYTADPGHYQNRILQHPNMRAQFKKDTGYPREIENLGTFRAHSVTQQKLQRSLAKKGLDLPVSWDIRKRRQFSEAVAKKVKDEADSRWRSAMQQQNLDLPTNLSWQEFQAHPSVQLKIEQYMGDMYVPNVRADWNQASFKRYILDPNIERRTQRYLDMVEGARPHFVDGGKYAEDGVQALRSVIVPPISMSLSLFLICLTLVKLPIKLVEALKPRWIGGLPKWSSLGVRLTPVVLVVFVPVWLVENNFTKDSRSPVNYFLDKVSDSSTPVFKYALRWTLHAQPLMHPMGVSFEEKTSLYTRSAPLTIVFANVDERLPFFEASGKQQKSLQDTLKNESRLTIVTNVEGARIRIMNVVPKYHESMQLTPGNYDVEVSADGYQTYRTWYNIASGEQLLTIELSEARD